MCKRNSNSDARVLVLARPADSLCAFVAPALDQKGYTFSIHTSVCEVVATVENSSVFERFILVVRPEMLGLQAALYMKQRFPELKIIGWLDPHENISNWTIAQMTINGMVIVSCLEQLYQAIFLCSEEMYQVRPSEDVKKNHSQELEKLECKLSDDEINALLGVG